MTVIVVEQLPIDLSGVVVARGSEMIPIVANRAGRPISTACPFRFRRLIGPSIPQDEPLAIARFATASPPGSQLERCGTRLDLIPNTR